MVVKMGKARRFLRKARRSFRRGEPGFVMVVVLVALLMLSVLGAASLLLMVSSMQGILNIVPEQRAFLIAEAGLYTAHSFIVEKGTQAVPFEGSILGGKYEVDVQPKAGSQTEFIVTSLGTYTERGVTYRRKIREEVIYSGEQTFDVLRNYVMFAGHNLEIELGTPEDPQQVVFDPIVIDGAVRAENDVNVKFYAMSAYDDALIFLGSPIRSMGGIPVDVAVEAGNDVYVDVGGKNRKGGGMEHDKLAPPPNPYDVGGVNVQFYGDMRARNRVRLKVFSGDNYAEATKPNHSGNGQAAVFAAAYGPVPGDWKIIAPVLEKYIAHEHDVIYQGEYVNGNAVDKVYIPKPNYEYYKLLAMDQNNFYDVGPGGTATITGQIMKSGISSMTVFYSTGNMVLSSDSWSDPNMNGVFVCEGDFIAVNTTGMKENSTLQVIAKGDVYFDSRWSGNFKNPLDNAFFLYAGNDIHLCTTRFSVQQLQATALHDIYLTNDRSWSFAKFWYRPPQVDVAGWPIDIKVINWMELPVD